jgi:hypothetical protein
MARTTEITAQELGENLVEDTPSWVDSEHFEALLRDARADPALLHELDALLTDRSLSQARRSRLARESRSGFSQGIASVFSVLGTGRPAPPRVRRGLGSLVEDSNALQRDSERLVHGRY